MSEKAKLMMEKLKLSNGSDAIDVSSFLLERMTAARRAAYLLHVYYNLYYYLLHKHTLNQFS